MSDKSDIPQNTPYCYDEDGVCPFYEYIENENNPGMAYCHYLDKSEDEYFLLADQVKECGVSIKVNKDELSNELNK